MPTVNAQADMAEHPSSEQLQAYATGIVQGEVATWIESHIALCDSCSRRLEETNDDPLIAMLRDNSSTGLSTLGQTNRPPSQRLSSRPLNHSSSKLRLTAGFEVLSELGRGGMGIVYLAWQSSLRREVALKMIARGDLANKDELIRFRREAEAAASLRHPSIAHVYDVGEQDGQPFIAMELVRGCTLSQHLKRGPLPIPTAVSLLVKLADAVRHAHCQLVIHRDLKPSNILLEGCQAHGSPAVELEPKIVDFGLAKRADSLENATLTGDLVGTPSYMSPEQAMGIKDVGPATDIYSLGAIFYECLVGRPPFQGASTMETLELVRSSEPVRPTNLRPGMHRDLETICLKCLEKNPNQRYLGANDLLEDLEHFQAGRPIRARPTGWVGRFHKWARRRPALATLLAVIVLAIASLIGLGLSYNRSLRLALNTAREEEARANKNFQFAFRSIEQLLERVGFDQLTDRPEMEELREELMSSAVAFYSELLETQPTSDQESRRQYYRALAKLGTLQGMLGQAETASDNLQKAIDLQSKLAEEFPKRPEIQHELAVSILDHGMLEKNATEIRRAVDLLRSIEPNYPACRTDLAEALNDFAIFSSAEERERFHNASLEVRQQLLKDFPEDPRLQLGVGHSHYNLGLLFHQTGRNDAAAQSLTNALSVFDRLADQHSSVSDYQTALAECLTSLASLCHSTGQTEEALLLIERGTKTRKLLSDRFPKIPILRRTLARGYLTHAAFLIQTGQFAKAMPLCESAVTIAEQLESQYSNRDSRLFTATSLTILATTASGLRDNLNAEKAFERAHRIYEELLVQTPDDANCLAEAGVNCMNFSNVLRLDRPEIALDYNNRSIDLLGQALKQDPARTDLRSYLFNAHGASAQTFESLKRHAEAAEAWRLTLELANDVDRDRLRMAEALALARAGNRVLATDRAQELAAKPATSPADLYNLACLFGLIHHSDPNDQSSIDSALELLSREPALEFLRLNENRQQLMADPDLATIRSDPGFQKLLERLEAPGKK